MLVEKVMATTDACPGAVVAFGALARADGAGASSVRDLRFFAHSPPCTHSSATTNVRTVAILGDILRLQPTNIAPTTRVRCGFNPNLPGDAAVLKSRIPSRFVPLFYKATTV